jgi:serine protease Do
MKRNAVAWAALVVAMGALLSSTGFLRPMPAAPKVTEEGQRAAKALSQAFNAVAEFARPSVVQISVQKKAAKGFSFGQNGARRFQNPNQPGMPFDQDELEKLLRRFPFLNPESGPQKEQFSFGPAKGLGSGFVYDNHGHILTNNHVVENADKITVTFWDGVEAKGTVVGTDSQTDVAVVKVDNTSYPPIPKGDSSKIISALERNSVSINTYESFIQTDAPINRGNSGGPLVDMDGQVIGINSAIVSGSQGNDGIGFTIPINMASRVADMLIKDGKVRYARIGIHLDPLTPALARTLGMSPDTKGVMVGEVLPGSPAEKAGLKQGDVIVGFAGGKVDSLPSFRLKVATSEVAKPFDLTYVRDGSERTVKIVPAAAETVKFAIENENPAEEQETPKEPAKAAVGDFGLDVQPLNPSLAKSLGIPADVKGLVVTEVKDGSPAEAAGIQQGDVITKVIRDHKPQALSSVKDLQDLASKSDELGLYVQRGKVGAFRVLSKNAN